LHGLEIQNILLKQPFYRLEFQINFPPVIQNIFRPPKYWLLCFTLSFSSRIHFYSDALKSRAWKSHPDGQDCELIKLLI
jgi:hypothetical protein